MRLKAGNKRQTLEGIPHANKNPEANFWYSIFTFSCIELTNNYFPTINHNLFTFKQTGH
jgi:hypothetical protein